MILFSEIVELVMKLGRERAGRAGSSLFAGGNCGGTKVISNNGKSERSLSVKNGW